MAGHLAHTALAILRDLSPDASHHAACEAVAMVTGVKVSTQMEPN